MDAPDPLLDPHASSDPEVQTKTIDRSPLPSDSNASAGLAEPEEVQSPPSEGSSPLVPEPAYVEPTDVGPASIIPPNPKPNIRIRDQRARPARPVESRAGARRDPVQTYSQVCPIMPIRENSHI